MEAGQVLAGPQVLMPPDLESQWKEHSDILTFMAKDSSRYYDGGRL
jgi:hypothetical protein